CICKWKLRCHEEISGSIWRENGALPDPDQLSYLVVPGRKGESRIAERIQSSGLGYGTAQGWKTCQSERQGRRNIKIHASGRRNSGVGIQVPPVYSGSDSNPVRYVQHGTASG